MRLGALSAFAVLGASLVAATPIRVVVTEVSSSVRYGHAAGDGHDAARIAAGAIPLEFINSSVAVATPGEHRANGRHWCQSVRTKALDASNALRQMLGLEPIQPDPHFSRPHNHGMRPVEVEAIPMPHDKQSLPVLPFVGTPVRPAFVADGDRPMMDGPPGRRPMWHHGPGPHRHASFLRRVHRALMMLGPWEGRAVAFVLGCGIGVLLRMFWVMVLVSARAIRGSRDDEAEYDVVFDEAEMLVPPPQYTIIAGAEAVPVADEKELREVDTPSSN